MMWFLTSWPAGLLFLVSFVICGALVATRRLHLHRTMRADDGCAVQSAHSIPTPRVGGIGVVVAFSAGFLWLPGAELDPVFSLLVVSMVPIFVAGLAEDLGLSVSANRRLLAAAISAALAVYLMHLWVGRVAIPGVDRLFAVAPIAIAFTIFASTGLCNAFNLIDGVNGFAGGTGILVALGLGGIAIQAGDADLAQLAFAMVPAIFGFLVFNFPQGKIFLGDAGAYAMGHALAWISILLASRLPGVSPWAIILVFFWPIADTLFAMYRRSRSRRRLNQPDHLHFHQLVMRGIEIGMIGRGRRHIANPLTTVVLLPLVGTPVATAVVLWDHSGAAAAAVALYGVLFFAAYLFGLNYFKIYARTRRRNRAHYARLRANRRSHARSAAE